MKALDAWLKEKIPTYYIMVDPDTQQECENLVKFADPKGF
jgi:hypothetical protein